MELKPGPLNANIGKIWYPTNGLNGWWLTQLARSEGIWQLDRLAYIVFFLTRSLPVICAFGNHNYI